MKKIVIPISILALAVVGFILLSSNETIENETENTQIVQTQNKEEIENKNQNTSSQEQEEKVEPQVVTQSTSTGEIVNPITGETHPASYYDEVLTDGYTYNNPAPIPEDWIIEPATDEYPATLDYYKIKDTLSESYIHNGRITKHFTMVPEYMIGYNPRILLFNTENKFETKKDFLNWLSNYTDSDIYFVSESEFDNKNGGTNWNIFIKSSNMEVIYNSYYNLTKEEKLYMRVSSFYLPKYRGTKELQNAIDSTNRAVEL